MIRLAAFGVVAFVAVPALAEQPLPPSWEELAIQSQAYGARVQVTSANIIAVMQEEISRLRAQVAELSKAQHAASPEPPK
jgi:hypothetical protein